MDAVDHASSVPLVMNRKRDSSKISVRLSPQETDFETIIIILKIPSV